MPGAPNLDLSTLSFGMRELVIAAIILVLVYMLWQVFQMLRLAVGSKPSEDSFGSSLLETKVSWPTNDEPVLMPMEPLETIEAPPVQKAPPPQQTNFAPTVTSISGKRYRFDTEDEAPAEPRVLTARDEALREALKAEIGVNIRHRNEPFVPPPLQTDRVASVPMQRDESMSQVRDGAVREMERELEDVRGEVSELKKSLSSLQNQWKAEMTQVQMSQNSSPIYGDAMRLAMQGFDAVIISDRCNIPLGEATLVVALAGKTRQRA
jgi:cytoskeletal protein RodZ